MRYFFLLFMLGSLSGFAQQNDGITLKGNKLILTEVPPIWPGCEAGDVNAKNSCFGENLKVHLRETFTYPKSFIPNKIKEQMLVTFNIDVTGKAVIKNVVGGTIALQDEAIRTIAQIPLCVPAKMAGKPREMKFTVPFAF